MKASRAVAGFVLGVFVCGVGFAGDISVLVLRGGAPVASAKAYAAGVSALTDASGKCVLLGVPAGKQNVFAEKVIGGTLYGAVRQDFAVTTGTASLTLNLAPAIRLNEYVPLTVNSYWAYKETIERPTGTTTKLRQEKVVGSAPIGSETAMKVRITWSGTTDTILEYSNCTPDGYARFREEHSSGDVVRYSPPMRFPNLAPQGQPLVAVCQIIHSSGATETVKMVVTLQGFEDVTVPAGTFANCARIKVERAVGTVVERGTIWFAKGVGKVKNIEAKPDRKCTQLLEKYQIAP